MIRSIYKNRIETIKKDYRKLYSIILSKNIIIDEYLVLKDEVIKEIETITENDNIEPNLKYIDIDKKIKYIEVILSKISDIQNTNDDNLNKLNKEKDIIISSCIEEHSNITREKVLIELEILFKK